MSKDRLTPPQKIIASIFAVMVLLSFVFIGYRIATKSAYNAHEAKQCRLLAVSAVRTLAEKTNDMPDMWSRIGSGDITLIIDHKTMPGNWVLEVTAKQTSDCIYLRSSAGSGWNSRSPQKAVIEAKIFKGKNAVNIVYDNSAAAATAAEISKATNAKSDKRVLFRFPDELKICPVPIYAAVSSYFGPDGDSTFIILSPAD